MRVTSNLMFRNGMEAMQTKQQQLVDVQEKTLTGNRINRPSDDPTSVYRHMLFSSDLSGVNSLVKTTEFASQRITLADGQIGQIHERMLDAQDLALKMSSSSVGGVPQVMIASAEEALAMYREILTSINTEMDEIPIFGGGRTRTPYNESVLQTTQVRVQPNGEGSHQTADASMEAIVDSAHTLTDLPVSVKIRYDASQNTFEVDVNGKVQNPVTPTVNATTGKSEVDAGNGLTFAFDPATANAGDVYYFEVVPTYQGGDHDRLVRVLDGRTLPGNATAQEILEGTGETGRNVNILGAIAGLRGALLRADPTEVAVQLDRLQEGRAQVSDLQAISGIRVTQVDAVNNTLALDEAALTEIKATNVEADLVDVLSKLEQTSQAMQVMTISERQVLNTSLLDFIR